MAYFNIANDANPYFTSSTDEELDPYPVLSQISAGEWADIPVLNTFTYGWGMIDQPGPTAGSPTGPLPTTSCGKYYCSLFVVRCLTRVPAEPAAPASSHTTQVDGYAQPIYPDNHWPAVDQQTRLCHSDFLIQDGSFASTLESEASTVVPNPSSGESSLHQNFEDLGTYGSRTVSLDYWGMNEGGPATSTFYVVSA